MPGIYSISIVSLLLLCFIIVNYAKTSWLWQCNEINGTCNRIRSIYHEGNNTYSSLEICRLVCENEGNLWPKPNKFQINNKQFVNIDIRNAIVDLIAVNDDVLKLINQMMESFRETFDTYESYTCNLETYNIHITLNVATNVTMIDWNTDESYELNLSTNDISNRVNVQIEAPTAFGARHALETLMQSIESDAYQNNETLCFITLRDFQIIDQPFYKHRGLLIDSARNFISVSTIKKIITGMAMSKMNILHWHLSDSQSFPFASSSLPNMSDYGAYSENEIYSMRDIQELVEFAKIRAIQIIPEIDGPAHVGNGWQWGVDAGLGKLVVCNNWQPWRSFCVQPPCGQLNPANPNLYDILQLIYKDIGNSFYESVVFHMGGDEVFIPCWNSSKEILDYIGNKTNRSETVFLDLWGEYQEKALKMYDSVNGKNPIILWSSSLTDPKHIEKYLSKDRYVIQTWVPNSDTLPEKLIDLGYKLIISTKDKWYLDHGFWGNTAYQSWKVMYDNKILTDPNVLGGEVCMWGELVDDHNIESRIWPRAAAAAERLWSNSDQTSENVANRFMIHNERLRKRGGIRTSALTPKYCLQNPHDCKGSVQ